MLGFLAVLMAIVGSIGLGSVLGINVLERRREIGVMRAIGASDAIIRNQLIGEDLTLGLVSWLIAVPLSYPTSWLIKKGTSWMVQIEFSLVYSFAGVLILVGDQRRFINLSQLVSRAPRRVGQCARELGLSIKRHWRTGLY